MNKNFHNSIKVTKDGAAIDILFKLHNQNVIVSNLPCVQELLDLQEKLYFFYDDRDKRPKAEIHFNSKKKKVNLSRLLYYIYQCKGEISSNTIGEFLNDTESKKEEIDHLDNDILNNTKYNLASMSKKHNLSKRGIPDKYYDCFDLVLCNDGQYYRVELVYLVGRNRLYSVKYYCITAEDLALLLEYLTKKRWRWEIKNKRSGDEILDRERYRINCEFGHNRRIIPQIPMYERQQRLATLPITEFQCWTNDSAR